MENQIENILNSPMQGHSSNQFMDVITELSPSDYVNLVVQVIDYQKVIRQEEIKRDAIREQCNRDLTIALKKLELFEADIVSQTEILKSFIDETMRRIDKLIEEKQYEYADKLHERVSNNLQGRVSNVADMFNQHNIGNNVFFEKEISD